MIGRRRKTGGRKKKRRNNGGGGIPVKIIRKKSLMDVNEGQ